MRHLADRRLERQAAASPPEPELADPQANSALWHVVFTRMASDPRTIEYFGRRRMKEARNQGSDAVPQALRGTRGGPPTRYSLGAS